MKRLLTIACLLLLANSASPRMSSALMVEMNPSSIVRQESNLDRPSNIPLAEPRFAPAAIGPFHATKDALGETPASDHDIHAHQPTPGTELESLFAGPISRLLQVRDIVAPVKPAKSRAGKK